MAANPTFGFASLAEAKTRLDIDSGVSLHDSLLSELLLSVSSTIERIAGRKLRRQTSITEIHSGGKRLLQCGIFPIDSITNIRESETRDFTTASAYDELATPDDYILRAGEEEGESGIIERIDQDWLGSDKSPGMIRVVYDGGYLNDDDDDWPIPHDLRDACLTQAIHEYAQRSNPGRTSTSMRGVSIASGSSNTHEPMSILPYVADIALRYRRPIHV